MPVGVNVEAVHPRKLAPQLGADSVRPLVSRSRAHFKTAGEVYATETPGGEAAVAVHRGSYDRINEAHHAIGKWMAANLRECAGQ